MRSLALFVVCLLTGAGFGTATAFAHDEDGDGREEGGRLMIALDLDYSAALTNENLADTGGGGALRIGSEQDLFLVSLIPELTLDYHTFSGPWDATALTGKLGGRIRFLKIVEPGIFAHAGVGRIGGDDPHTGFAFDAGVTVDLTILPVIDLGLHAAWNRVFGGESHPGLSYATFGAHVALVL
jgi:hypothetical protein